MTKEDNLTKGDRNTSQPCLPSDTVTPAIRLGTQDQCEPASHRYQLQDEIARGSMGAIVKGHDSLLNRELAVKVLIDGDADDEQAVERFFAEAQINGQLQHPGIAPVYELGRLPDSRPFFAMKLIKGQTLRALLTDRSDLREERNRFLGIFEQVCQTMAYAHDRRVIHRDLKPSNIMVGAFGEVQVMDWGIAKVLHEESQPLSSPKASEPTSATGQIPTTPTIPSDFNSDGLNHQGPVTQAGVVYGSLAYMSPEQALGEKERVNEQTDVFGLGAILCEILTGVPPYDEESTQKLFRLAARCQMESAWQRLDQCDADPELIELTKSCLSYEPEFRPPHAGAVAEKMETYFESVDHRLRQAELEQAKAVEERKRRKIQLALASSIICTMLLSAAAWIWIQFQQAEINVTKLNVTQVELKKQQQLARVEEAAKTEALLAQQRETQLRKQAEAAKLETTLNLCDVYTARGIAAADQQDAGAAIMWFAAAAELADSDPVRRNDNLVRAKNWADEAAIPVGAIRVPGRPKSVEFQPGGDLVLIRYTPLEYSWQERVVHSTAFDNLESENLRWLKELKMPEIDSVKHEPLFTLFDWKRNHVPPWLEGKRTTGVPCWSPDGKNLAIAHPSGRLEIRRVHDGALVTQLEDLGEITALAYSPDGLQLAIATETVRIWQTDLKTFKDSRWDHTVTVHSMRFNHDGSMLVTAAYDSVAHIFLTNPSEPQKTPILALPHFDLFMDHIVYCKHAPVWLQSENGSPQIATICGKSEVAIWDIESKTLIEKIKSSPSVIGMTEASASGMLAIGGQGGFQVHHGRQQTPPTQIPNGDFISSNKFGRSGQTLLTGSIDTTGQLWSVPEMRPIGPKLHHGNAVGAVDQSDDGMWLATSTMRGLVRVWSRPKTNSSKTLQHYQASGKATFSPNGKLVATRKSDELLSDCKWGQNQIAIFDSESGTQKGTEIVVPGTARDLAFSSDNQLILVAHGDQDKRGYLSTYELTGHRRISTIDLPANPIWIAAHPSNRVAAIMGSDNQLCVLDLDSDQIRFRRQYTARTEWHSKIRFTPDGQKLIICNETLFEVIDVATGEPCFEKVEYPNANFENTSLAVSPDSKTFAVASSDSARFYSLETGQEIAQPIVQTQTSHYLAAIVTICFSPDSQLVLTSSIDSQARLWNWKTGAQACPPMQHSGEVHSAVFTHCGNYAVTGSRGKNCGPHIWDLKTGMRIAPSWNNSDCEGLHHVALSPDSKQLFGSEFTGTDYSMVKYDFKNLLEPSQLSTHEMQTIGGLTSSKRIVLGRTDKLSMEGWLTQWNQIVNKKFRLAFLDQENEATRR